METQVQAEKRRASWRKYYTRKKSEDPTFFKKINNKATLKYKDKKRFSGLKGSVLQRDSFKCVSCGNCNTLHIHHLNGISYHNAPEPDNRIENLVTLCRSCHTTLHHQLRGHKVKNPITL